MDINFKATIIEASAGTGKTRRLTSEYISCLESEGGVRSVKNFLALTFSEEVACEMRTRIIEKIWNDVRKNIRDEKSRLKLENDLLLLRVSTIHSFCRKLLKRFSFFAQLDPSFTVAEENYSGILFRKAVYSFLESGLSEAPGFREICGKIKLKNFVDYIDVLHKLHPHVFLGSAGDDGITKSIFPYFEAVNGIYREIKDARAVLDFNDLETRTYRLVRENREALNVLYDFDEAFDFIFVDEFQDTNFLQWEILGEFTREWISGYGSKAETGRKYGIFIVGDRKQSIYRFRGAESSVFDEASEFFDPCVKKDLLTKNYRSSTEIIGFVNDVFKDHVPESEELVPCESPGKLSETFIEIKLFPADERSVREKKREEYAWLAKRILKLLSEKFPVMDKNKKTFRPVRFRDIAIVFRRRTYLEILEQTFREYGLPFVNVGGIGFYQEPEIIFMLSLVFCLIDGSDSLSMWNLRNSFQRIDGPFYIRVPEKNGRYVSGGRLLKKSLKR